MEFIIKPMDRASAVEISTWTYEAPYDIYNSSGGQETIDELRNGTYFRVMNDHEVLVGYCCFGKSAQVPIGQQFGAYPDNGTMDVGLGMRPDLTGQGLGFEFFRAILAFLESRFGSTSFRLTVATFNCRAIKLYQRLGFVHASTFQRDEIEFITMERTVE